MSSSHHQALVKGTTIHSRQFWWYSLPLTQPETLPLGVSLPDQLTA